MIVQVIEVNHSMCLVTCHKLAHILQMTFRMHFLQQTLRYFD